MRTIFACTLLAAFAASPLRAENPVFDLITGPGLVVQEGLSLSVTKPTMADGLSAEEQNAILADIAGNRNLLREMLRKSPVARHVVRLGTEDAPGFDGVVRRYDAYFVAYGDLQAFRDPNFLEEVLSGGQNEGEGRELTAEELAERNIKIADSDHEAYGYGTYDLRGMVNLKVVGRVAWSDTPDSIIVAAMVDPRFTNDPKLGNLWQPIQQGEPGDFRPYGGGSGFYFKVTKLHEPEGALFCEYHGLVTEPKQWFNGRNPLGSLFPQIMQKWVTDIRKELLRRGG